VAWITPHTGELRHKVGFYRGGTTTNVGGVLRQFTSPAGNVGGVIQGAPICLIGCTSAKIEATRGGQEVIAGRLSGRATYDIWLRSTTQSRGLLAGDICINARTRETYSLGAPLDPDGRRRWVLIQATSTGRADQGA
jgi:hypothetical protein